ncbi:MAG: glyoxalase [Luteimonas sp.]
MIDLQSSEVRTFVPAKDFLLSKEFYSALGCNLEWSDDNLALLNLAGSRFYLQRYYVKDWAENSMLHISVQDSAQCFSDISKLLESGRFPSARVAAPKHEPYGASVTYVWDPSGVLLHLAQWDRA